MPKQNLSGSDYINFFGLALSLIVWCYLLMSCHAFFGDVLQFQLSDSVHRWGHSSSHVDRPHQPPLNQVRLMLYLLPLVAILLPLVVIALIVIYCKNPHCRWKLPEAELGAVGACKHTLPLFGNLQVQRWNFAPPWLHCKHPFSETGRSKISASDFLC